MATATDAVVVWGSLKVSKFLFVFESVVYLWICVDLVKDAVMVLPKSKLFTIPTKGIIDLSIPDKSGGK